MNQNPHTKGDDTKDNIFGVKIKTYDWMKDDEIALVLPATKNITKFPDGHEEEVTVKEAQMVIIKKVKP